jgi:hypothetical protein
MTNLPQQFLSEYMQEQIQAIRDRRMEKLLMKIHNAKKG